MGTIFCWFCINVVDLKFMWESIRQDDCAINLINLVDGKFEPLLDNAALIFLGVELDFHCQPEGRYFNVQLKTDTSGLQNAISDQIDYKLRHRAVATLSVAMAMFFTRQFKGYTLRDFSILLPDKYIFNRHPKIANDLRQEYASEFLFK